MGSVPQERRRSARASPEQLSPAELLGRLAAGTCSPQGLRTVHQQGGADSSFRCVSAGASVSSSPGWDPPPCPGLLLPSTLTRAHSTHTHRHTRTHHCSSSPASALPPSTVPGRTPLSRPGLAQLQLLSLTQTTSPLEVLRTRQSQKINTGHLHPLEDFLQVGSSERGKRELNYTLTKLLSIVPNGQMSFWKNDRRVEAKQLETSE